MFILYMIIPCLLAACAPSERGPATTAAPVNITDTEDIVYDVDPFYIVLEEQQK